LGANVRAQDYAAASFLELTATIADRPCAVRRMDGDRSGLLTDPQDRVWIDLDHAGP
jgi:hypothetical protein